MTTQEQILKLIQDAISQAHNGNNTPNIQDTKNQNLNGVQYGDSGRASEESNHYYSEILNNSNGNFNSLEELYQALGFGMSGNNMTTEQREDFLKMLVEKMIAKQELNEQRAFDSPAAQLSRLLQTGMSKDAALQAISGGSGSGSGSGSPLIGAASSPAPSESYANEVAANTQIANTAFNAVACAANVASFGISVPGQIANNTISKVSAKATTQAQSALEGINSGVEVLNACVSAGLIDKKSADEASRSSRTLHNALDYCANKDPNSPAAKFLNSDSALVFDNPYAERMANERYKNARSADDYAVELGYRFDALNGAHLLQQLDIEQSSLTIARMITENANLILDGLLKDFELYKIKPEEVLNMQATRGFIGAQTQTEFARRNNINADTKLKHAQRRLTFSEIAYRKAATANLWADTHNKQQLNNILYYQSGILQQQHAIQDSILSTDYQGKSGLQWLTQSVVGDYAYNALKYGTLTGTEYQKSFQDYLLNDVNFLRTNAIFRFTYENDAFNTYRNSDNSPFLSDQSIMRYFRGCKQIYNGPYYGNQNYAGGAASNAVGAAIGAMLRIP